MYGIIISLSIVIALYLGEKIAKDNNFDTNCYWGASLWAIISGVVGARLYHVIDYYNYYSTYPIRVLFLHQGGLGIYGALIGGSIGLYIYLRVKKKSVLKYLNLAAIVMPLAQAIGRWANYTNMELYGLPTNLPWGLYVPEALRPPHLVNNDVYHPLFIYESLLDILLFFLLWLLYQRKTMLQKSYFEGKQDFSMRGFFTLAYLIGYGIIRFSLEFLRINPWQIYGINVAQVISAIFVLTGSIGIYKIIKGNISLPRINRNLLLFLSALGIAISSYLFYTKITDNTLVCGASQGCNAVQKSKYSTLLGLPLGLWGMGYYFILFTLFYLTTTTKTRFFRAIFIGWGVLFSLYLTALEAFVIKAYCLWCLGSFVNITLISLIYFLGKYDRRSNQSNTSNLD